MKMTDIQKKNATPSETPSWTVLITKEKLAGVEIGKGFTIGNVNEEDTQLKKRKKYRTGNQSFERIFDMTLSL